MQSARTKQRQITSKIIIAIMMIIIIIVVERMAYV